MSDSCEQTCSRCQCQNRRGFLATLGGFAALALLWPRRAWAKKLAIRLDKVPQLKTVGGSISLKIKGVVVLLFRDTATTVRAVSGICTHQKTPTTYSAKVKLVLCPQHGSTFSADGKVLKGPAKVPLPSYWTKLDLEKGRVLLKL